MYICSEKKQYKKLLSCRLERVQQVYGYVHLLLFIYIFIFGHLNLPYFTKKAEECVTDFEKWIYVLKHMTTLERIPFETQKKIFKRLAEVADSRCLSKEEMEKYEESQRQVDNYNLGMYSAWLEGNEKGIKQGIEQGIEQGKLSTNLAVAKNLLALGMPVSQIMQVTGLTKEQISSLQAKK